MKNLPACIYKDKKITVSADGSVMFYSLEYQETYRAKSIGAFTESYHKFVKAGGILEKAAKKDVRILDICFGLGYNCAVTFYYANKINSNKVHIVSVEKDPHLPYLINDIKYLWPIDGYNILRECLGFKNKQEKHKRFSMEMHIMDALQAVELLNGEFDTIYFDPFSSKKNPEMWSIEVFAKMRELLSKDGVLVTYACSKTVRDNMLKAGLRIETVPTATGAFHPGTKCLK